MGDNTAISWCDATFNGWLGCTKVSPACDGCYAEAMMDTRYGRVKWGGPGKGVGTRERTSEANWRKPLAWDRAAAKDHSAYDALPLHARRGPRPAPFVFCSSLADVFDSDVPMEWRVDLFDLIRRTPNLVWLLLTKRPGNIVRLAEAAGGLPPNAAIGCTVVTQEEADRDVPKLLAAKAALNPAFAFLSMEPLLGQVDLTTIDIDGYSEIYPLTGTTGCEDDDGEPVPDWPALDWIITGGETDQGSHKARPTHPQWFRDIRDQCAAAGIPYHHKQNGEWAPDEGPLADGRDPIMAGARCSVWSNGWTEYRNGYEAPLGGRDTDRVYRVGKRAAGRTIDGQVHDSRPIHEPRP